MRGSRRRSSRLKQLEDEGDRVVHDAIAALFRDDRIDPLIVIRWKDIYEALEKAIDACETAANVIGNIAVKNALSGAHARRRRRGRAVLRLHERLPRHGELDRDERLDPRAVAAGGRAQRGGPQLPRRFRLAQVAATIASGIVNPDAITLNVVLAGLVGAITWNLVTWYLGLPSSSSHALIGGILGSSIAASGLDVVNWDGIVDKVLLPSLIAPVAGFVVAAILMLAITWLIRRRAPGLVNRVFRRLQLVSGGFVAFTHGTNDAQKTMGIIALALVVERPSRGGRGSADLGHRQRRAGHVGGHLCRRLADHQDARHKDREARPAAGLRRADGVRRDPLDDRALRVPRLDDPHDLGRRSWARAPRGACRPCAGA